MRRVRSISLVVLISMALAGCESNPKASTGAVAGALIGATAGALTGSSSSERRRNAAIGTFVGAAIGAGIGAHFDRQDRERQMAAAYTATTTGRRSSWSDPRKGTGGTVEPIGYAMTRPDGTRCRQYGFQDMVRGVVVNSGQGLGCIDADGEFTSS